MKKQIVITLVIFALPATVLADSVTSVEMNGTPVSGYSGEAYTDPGTHIASPNTNGTHIVDIVGNGVTATQTANYGGSGLSQVAVNLNGLQTAQGTSNTTAINTVQNEVTNVSKMAGPQGAQGVMGPQGPAGSDAIAPAIDPRLDVEIREYDAKHWSMSSFASFGMQTSTARYIVGQKLVLKLGRSYEECELERLRKTLGGK